MIEEKKYVVVFDDGRRVPMSEKEIEAGGARGSERIEKNPDLYGGKKPAARQIRDAEKQLGLPHVLDTKVKRDEGGRLFKMDAYADEMEGAWDLDKVKSPGKRGGKFYRTKKGHVRYGEKGTGKVVSIQEAGMKRAVEGRKKIFHDRTIELLQALHKKTGATAIPTIIENVSAEEKESILSKRKNG